MGSVRAGRLGPSEFGFFWPLSFPLESTFAEGLEFWVGRILAMPMYCRPRTVIGGNTMMDFDIELKTSSRASPWLDCCNDLYAVVAVCDRNQVLIDFSGLTIPNAQMIRQDAAQMTLIRGLKISDYP
jgi:hypothetical protein